MHETGLGKSLERQEKEQTRAWFTQKEQRGRRPRLNLVAWRCRASTLLLRLVQDVKHRLLILKSTRRGPKSITSRWRSSPSLSEGSGVTNAAAVHAASHGHAGSECFSSSSSSTSSSTFLLHAASQPGSSPARRLSRAAGRSRQARPRLLPAVPEAHRAAAVAASERASERAQLNQTLEHPHVPAAHREGYRTGMLLRSYTIYQKSGKLEIILDSMAWKRAIRANAQRHTSTSHKRSLSLAHTPRQT